MATYVFRHSYFSTAKKDTKVSCIRSRLVDKDVGFFCGLFPSWFGRIVVVKFVKCVFYVQPMVGVILRLKKQQQTNKQTLIAKQSEVPVHAAVPDEHNANSKSYKSTPL